MGGERRNRSRSNEFSHFVLSQLAKEIINV